MSLTDVRSRALRVPFWFHSIDLGGFTTEGHKTPERLARELQELRLPDLRGKTVLDIGAWDGFFSFECERGGASRVVSLDRFVWAIDREKAHGYYARCVAEGLPPRIEESDAWDPSGLPGKRGYDLAHEALGSNAEAVVAEYRELNYQEFGRFDVVLYLGVLYHETDPLGGLTKAAEATRGLCVVETAAVYVPGFEDRDFCEFYPANELGGDVTNWWAPNARALEGMCRAAGFRRVEVVKRLGSGEPARRSGVLRSTVGHALREVGLRPPLPRPEVIRGRIVAHAWT